jgi:hypothetical protein
MSFSVQSQVERKESRPIGELSKIIRSLMFKLNISSKRNNIRRRKIFEEAVTWWMKGRVLYKSEFTLADEYGVCQDTISRDVNFLVESHLLEIKRRNDNSNVYLLSQYCYIPEILDELIRWFPALEALKKVNVELTESYSNEVLKKDAFLCLDILREESLFYIRWFLKELRSFEIEKQKVREFFSSKIDEPLQKTPQRSWYA